MRVKIFIDFWNFQLAWNGYHGGQGTQNVVKIPWNPRLYEVLVSSIDKTAVYAGTHVFASFDPLSKKDLQLRKFLNVMDSFPGYDVVVKERKPLHHLRWFERRLSTRNQQVSTLRARDSPDCRKRR